MQNHRVMPPTTLPILCFEHRIKKTKTQSFSIRLLTIVKRNIGEMFAGGSKMD